MSLKTTHKEKYRQEEKCRWDKEVSEEKSKQPQSKPTRIVTVISAMVIYAIQLAVFLSYALGLFNIYNSRMTVLTAIDMILNVLDSGELSYFILMRLLVGALYFIFLIALLNCLIKSTRYAISITKKERSYTELGIAFEYIYKGTSSAIAASLSLVIIASLLMLNSPDAPLFILLGTFAVATRVAVFLKAFVENKDKMFTIAQLMTSVVVTVSIFMMSGVLSSPSLQNIILGWNEMVDASLPSEGRALVYTIYFLVAEKVLMALLTFRYLKCVGQFLSISNLAKDKLYKATALMKKLLITAAVLTVVKVVIVLFCGYDRTSLDLTLELFKSIFNLTKSDLLPVVVLSLVSYISMNVLDHEKKEYSNLYG